MRIKTFYSTDTENLDLWMTVSIKCKFIDNYIIQNIVRMTFTC